MIYGLTIVSRGGWFISSIVFQDDAIVMLLYCIIVLYCIVLYCVVLYCIVLYCIVLYCIVLYYVVSYRIVGVRIVCFVLYYFSFPSFFICVSFYERNVYFKMFTSKCLLLTILIRDEQSSYTEISDEYFLRFC